MKKLIFHPFFIILITFSSIILFFSLKKTNQKAIISHQNIANLEQDLTEIKDQIATNENELYQAKQDFTKEKILRDELLLQKEGEYVVQLPLVEEEKPAKPTTIEETPWEAWQNLLFGK